MQRPTISDDLRGQLWVAIGIPVGLACLARAAGEIEAGLKRRVGVLADLETKIGEATVELRRVLAERRPDQDDGHDAEPLPGGRCVAPDCKDLALPGTWYCADDTKPAPAAEVTPGQVPE